MGAADGKRAAVGAAVAEMSAELAAQRAESAGVQLPLIALPTRFEGDRAADQVARAARGRGPGRPPGAQNKATADLKQFLRARGFDPAEFKVRWAQHTPETLAAELGCTMLEAWDRLDGLHSELMGYIYGKALPVDGAGNAVPYLGVMIGNAQVAIGAGGAAPWLQDPRRASATPVLEQNQELNGNQTVSDGAFSHDTVSHDEAKSLK